MAGKTIDHYVTGSIVLITTLLALCLWPIASAQSATPPTLVSPADNASVEQGRAIKFEWSGTLGGDESARKQSHFLVEIISAASMPSGQQAQWTATERSVPTELGVLATSIKLGAPAEGAWRWRVCSYGVEDVNIANEITQLANGCSPARTLTVVAQQSSAAQGAIGLIDIKKESAKEPPAQEAPPAAIEPVAEEVAEPAPVVKERVNEVVEEEEPVYQPQIEQAVEHDVAKKGSALDLSNTVGFVSDDEETTAQFNSVAGAALSGLNSSLPGIPIPYWTLVFLVLSLPTAVYWRRDVVGMFEWPDGSIDGEGTVSQD